MTPIFWNETGERQVFDLDIIQETEKVQGIKKIIAKGKSPGFSEDDHGVLWYKGRICVPDVKKIKDTIL
jgi:hypothetical protein